MNQRRLWTLVMMAGALWACASNAAENPAPPSWDNLPAVQPAATDWPWWRGINRDGLSAPDQNPPVEFDQKKNVLWQVDVPGKGHATPCIWGDRILIPTADDAAKTQSLICYDRKTGAKLWQTQAHSGTFPPQHGKSSNASSTPACDGKYVFMPFVVDGAIFLTAFELDGKIAWQKRLGDFRSMHGYGASPVIYRSLVIVAADNLKNSFIVAVHRGTGEIVWKADRADYKLGTYASPIVARVAGRDQLLHHGPFKVFSYDPLTGKELWACDGPSESASSTMLFSRDRVFSSVGFPLRNMFCIRADGQGDVTKTHIVWAKKNKMAYVPTPLLADGLIYMVDDAGPLTCINAQTGEVVWTTKLDGKFSASPALAGGRIYVPSEAGIVYVFKAGKQFELIARNDLADGCYATPVICGNRIYLRTFHRLYCIGINQ